MEVLTNPWRGQGLPQDAGLAGGRVHADPARVRALLSRCPAHAPTPLHEAPVLAAACGLERLWLKDERDRMGLGSFKALGAASVLARMAADRVDPPGGHAAPEALTGALAGTTVICASAGNHGLSVAAGARAFGARAVVVLSRQVPEAFAERLRTYGAQVVRAGGDYEASMAAAERRATRMGWVLLSDSSWPGYTELPTRVMEGYLAMADEAADALPTTPSHVLLQAGVGGMAAAVTALVRARFGDGPMVIVVEPRVAAPLQASIAAGRPVATPGPASAMGRLDCKEASHVALGELSRAADAFVTLTDEEVEVTSALLAAHGFTTSPSGAAGLAACQHARTGDGLQITPHSKVLAILTEAAVSTAGSDAAPDGRAAGHGDHDAASPSST